MALVGGNDLRDPRQATETRRIKNAITVALKIAAIIRLLVPVKAIRAARGSDLGLLRDLALSCSSLKHGTWEFELTIRRELNDALR